LLIVVSALFTWFIILPKRSDLALKQEALAVIKKQESEIAGQLARLQELVDSLNASEKEIELLDQSLPLNGRITRFHFLIEALAQQAGVTLGNLNVSSPSTGPVAGDLAALDKPFKVDRKLQKLSGSVVVIGTLNQLKGFLEKVETSGRLIDITDVGIDAGTNGDLNLRLTINSYYFGQ